MKKKKAKDNSPVMVFDPPVATRVEGLPSLDNVPALGFDTETTTEPWLFDRSLAGISYFLPDGRKGYLPLCHPGGGNFPEENVREWARRALRGKTLVCAAAKHEHHTLKKWGVDLEEQGCSFRDVFHAAGLLQEKRYKINMDVLCREEGLVKADESHTLLHQLPVDEAAAVAVEDAELAWKLDEIYAPRIEAEGLGRVLQLENDLVFSTCEMERNGCHIDVPLLLKWRVEVSAELEARVMRLHAATGMGINPNSPEDMSRLFAHLGIDNEYKTDGGNESFTEEALLNYAGDDPLVQTALEARQLASLKSKCLDKFYASARPDGRLYYSLHQMRSDDGGTITGRYSSSAMYKAKDGGINVQQVMKTKKMPPLLQQWPIRRLFVAPPGERWMSSDASQIEYRTFAHFAALTMNPDTGERMTRIAEMYREDPHRDFHAIVMKWTGLNRDFTKNVNFAKLYGARAKKIALMCGVSLSEGYRIEAEYDREFPEAIVLLNVAQAVAENRGFVKTLLGRRRRYDAGDKFYSALNSVLQGSAADLMKLKLLLLYRERKRLGLTMRSTVHDESNNTVPMDADYGAIADFMDEQLVPMQVPILWETIFGPNWEDAKKFVREAA